MFVFPVFWGVHYCLVKSHCINFRIIAAKMNGVPIFCYFYGNYHFQVVEKTDLLGRDFLWEICLNTPDENIADSAIQLLLGISYTNLNSKLKKVCLSKLNAEQYTGKKMSAKYKHMQIS